MLRNQGGARRRWLLFLTLLAVLAVSVFGFTLATYVKEIHLFDGGWIGPKRYAFEVGSVSGNQSLAPGETAAYTFTVTNANAAGVAQIPLQVSIEIGYPAQLAGTGSIKAQLYRDGALLAATTGTGALAATGATLPANQQTTDTYTLKLTWQDADLAYLSGVKTVAFDPSQLQIRVSGYQ